METGEKSPFRLWVETEMEDSRTSFNLPSPQLVEKSGASTPELFNYEFESPGLISVLQKRQNRDRTPPVSSSLIPPIRIGSSTKFPGSPGTNSRLWPLEDASARPIESPNVLVQKEIRKRGLSPSQSQMKRKAKVEAIRSKVLPDVHRDSIQEAKSHLSFIKKTVAAQNFTTSALAYGLTVYSPKSVKVQFRALESPKALTRQRRDTPKRQLTSLQKAKKALELVTKQRIDAFSPHAKAGISPHPPLRVLIAKSPNAKIQRSLTPHDRLAFKYA